MSEPTPGDIELDDQEQQLFELLDSYVEAVRRGRRTIQGLSLPEFLEEHPDLKPLVACLDSLEGLSVISGVRDPQLVDDDNEDESAGTLRTVLSDPSDPNSGPSSRSSSLFKTLPADFGCYELLEEIGRGGMGVVYRARHKSLDASVAIKMIRSSELASDDEIRRFYQEARAAAGLAHSHIIKVHDVGEEAGLHFLAMDYIDGHHLGDLLKQEPLAHDRAAELLASIARAVHYLHSKGVIHRDLKPSNILLDEDGEPFVTDFGLAKLQSTDSHETTTGTIIGTPCYMSPEQAWGKPNDVTVQSDVYSLGAIFYEMLSGRPPFQEDNPLDVLLRVRESEPIPPTQWNKRIPTDLELICLRCLEKSPERRYQSAEALAEDLERFLKGEPLNLPPVGIGHRLKKWARREPGLVSHWIGILFVASIVQINFMRGTVEPIAHWPVMSLLGAWAIVSWLCQKLLWNPKIDSSVPFLWGAADAVFFSGAVYLAAEPRELLFVGYPLLIVASGFWSRVRLVWFMTAVCLVSYIVLYVVANDLNSFAAKIDPSQTDLDPSLVRWPAHYPYLVGGILCLVGCFVAYQVHRLRIMSKYFERHR